MQTHRTLATALLVLAGLGTVAQAAPPLAYVTNERSGVSVVDLDTLAVVHQIDVGGKGPRGIAITSDGKLLLTANKGTGDVSVIDTASGEVVRRVPIGENPEFIRIVGGLAYVTYEPGPPGGPPDAAPPPAADKKDEDDASAEVAVFDIASSKVLRRIKSGRETEGMEFSADGRQVLVTNEGDNTVSAYDRKTGRHVRTLKTGSYGNRPRGIKLTPDGKGYVVTLEFSDKLLVLDKTLKVVKVVPTRSSPYGLAFDPAGQRLFVAAAKSGVVQVFSAGSYELQHEIPVGKRCWHFSFTPDGSRLLVACGRSDALHVIDAQSYESVSVLDGFNGPWGVVTAPKSAGSLDAR